ncbi:MAG: PaaI family thioesterase [Acidobacteriota bacterium]
MSTYPPPGHFLGELGIEFSDDAPDWRESAGTSVSASMHADGDLSYDGQRVPAGVLATFVDLVAGRLCAAAARPDWVATSDLSVSLARPLRTGDLSARGHVVRAGRNLVTAAVDLAEGGLVAAQAPAAHSVSAFGRLGGDSRGSSKKSGSQQRQGSGRPAVTRPAGHLIERLGLTSRKDSVAIDLRDYTRNSLGALQGGVAAMVFERAALDEAARRGLESAWVCELAVRYLSLGRKGPFVTRCESVVEGNERLVLRLALHDEGTVRDAGPRLTSLATVAVRSG